MMSFPARPTLPCPLTTLSITLEQWRSLREDKNEIAALQLRVKFNTTVFSMKLLNADVFSSNSAASIKKKENIRLVREIFELYYTDALILEAAPVVQLGQLDGGLAIEHLILHFPKEIIDIIMPGGRGPDGALAQFKSSRAKKAESEYGYTPSHILLPPRPLLR